MNKIKHSYMHNTQCILAQKRALFYGHLAQLEIIEILYSRREYYSCTQLRNDLDAVKFFIFQSCKSNIGLFSIASCKIIALNLFYYQFFAFFLITLSCS